ncbi:MAG: hypothetical protein H2057_05865 [Alphaproteobacteria bacterium]|nr:hypothetical protein [Alphaproteobacteria bacterium]
MTFRFLPLFTFVSLLWVQASLSSIPEEYTPKEIVLKRTSVDTRNPFGSLHVPNRAGIREILDAANITEPLELTAPKVGGYGEVHFTKSYAIKITLSSNYSAETTSLDNLKWSQRTYPLSGFYLTLPKIMYKPSYETGFYYKVSTKTQHVYISERLRPVKDMESVARDALTTGSQDDLDLGYSFGFRLAEFQAKDLTKTWIDGDYCYCGAAHIDLNLRNIFIMSRPENGTPGAVALIDCADVVDGRYYSTRKPISVDMIYFLMKMQAFLPSFTSYNVLPTHLKKQRMESLIYNIFLGYFAGHTYDKRQTIKDFYLSDKSYNEANKNKYVFGGDISAYRTFHPIINSAFQSFIIPPQYPVLPNGFDAEKYIAVQRFSDMPEVSGKDLAQRQAWATRHFRDCGRSEGRQYLVTPRGFIPEAYLKANPDLIHSVKYLVSKAHQNLWLIGHYHHNGKNEGRSYFEGLPNGFKPADYLHLNKELVSVAHQQGCHSQGLLHSFAYDHYWFHGRYEGRPYLTTLPDGFDPLTYLNVNPDVLSVAKRNCNTQGLLRSYGYDHYNSLGFEEGRPYLAPAPKGFSPDDYLTLNPDVQQQALRQGCGTLGQQRAYAHAHYYLNGRNEGRSYLTRLPSGFSVANYLHLNRDLIQAAVNNGDNTQGKMHSFGYNHYYTRGYDEGRPYLVNLPQGFNPLTYLNANPDVLRVAQNTCSTEEKLRSYAYDHYDRHGRTEGRPYLAPAPKEFNPDDYLTLNPDVAQQALTQGLITIGQKRSHAHNHYYQNGRDEGRPYLTTLPLGFVAANYLHLNADVVQAATQNGDITQGRMRSFAFNHYTSCGRDEGRAYHVDLPQDFDPLLYLDSNPDVLRLANMRCQSTGQLKSFGYDHYYRVGRTLGLSYLGILPNDFKALHYFERNKDVFAQALNEGNTPEAIEEFAQKHYLRHGKRENRLYK